jgi:hypothetical protein
MKLHTRHVLLAVLIGVILLVFVSLTLAVGTSL